MSEVEFENNILKVKAALDKTAERFLEEAGRVIESQAIQNTQKGETRHTSQSWGYVVNSSKKEVTIGNTKENAIWEEYGTGEYALEPKRSGWWVYVKGERSKTDEITKRYSEAEAKKIVAILRKKGLEAYCTKGKRPRRMLHNAFHTKKSSLIRRAQQLMKEEME